MTCRVAAAAINIDFPGWGGDVSRAMEYLESSGESAAIRIVMPQPVAEIERRAPLGKPTALMHFEGPIGEFMKGYEPADKHVHFYASGDTMAVLAERIRVKLTQVLLRHVAKRSK